MKKDSSRRASAGRGGGSDSLPEKLKLSQARKYLGVSPAKMRSLVSGGLIKTESDPLDARVKLVRRADLEALKSGRDAEAGAAGGA